MPREDPTYPEPATDVPAGEVPGGVCPHCDRPFRTAHARDLHVGEHHEADMDEAERAGYEAALETERDDLWLFHAKAVVGLGVTYSATVLLYGVVLGTL